MAADEREATAAMIAERARLNRGFMDYVPHNRALGIEVIELVAAGATMRLPYDPRLIGDPESGALHGGGLERADGRGVRGGGVYGAALAAADRDAGPADRLSAALGARGGDRGGGALL